MTDMRRVTIALPDEIDREIYELRKSDKFVKCSYSEIIRQLVVAGLDREEPPRHDESGST